MKAQIRQAETSDIERIQELSAELSQMETEHNALSTH